MLFQLLLIESGAVFALLLISAHGSIRLPHWLPRLEASLSRLARRRSLCITLVILLALGGRLALWPLMKIPLPAVHGVFSYWMNSYWGGAAAAIGGSLLLGAMGRLMRRITLRDSFLFGLGIAILANSRPYEGFCLSLATVAALGYWLYRHKRPELIRK